MRSNDAITKEALLRAEKLQKHKTAVKKMIGLVSTSAAFCLMFICFAAMPRADTTQTPIQNSPYGSLVFAGNAIGGYVIVGILAFALGVVVTLVSLRSKSKSHL